MADFSNLTPAKNKHKNFLGLMISFLLLIAVFLLSSQNGSTSNKMTLRLADMLKNTFKHIYKGDYLKIEREGNHISFFYSHNESSWRMLEMPVNIEMDREINIGLVVSSRAEGKISTAVFDDIKIVSDSLTKETHWQSRDISSEALRGTGFEDNGKVTISSSGYEDWDRSDEYHYMYKTVQGDCTISARLLSIDNAEDWSLAGIVVRDTLEPGNKFAGVVITPRGFVSPQWKDKSIINMKWSHTALYEYNIKVRKTLHFLGYLILAICCYWALLLLQMTQTKRIILILSFCSIFAALDEFHQLFVPGRDAKITDVAIDIAGSILGLALVFVSRRIIIKLGQISH